MVTTRKRNSSPANTTKPSLTKKPKITKKNERKTEDVQVQAKPSNAPEISNARAREYMKGTRPKPIDELISAQSSTKSARANIPVKDAVVHWFKTDLRVSDNTALSTASSLSTEANVPLVCLYVVSLEDFTAHCVSNARLDFLYRNLEYLKNDLDARDIPLHIEVVHRRKDVSGAILAKLEEWGAHHLFCNMEYEVDELRREASLTKILLERGISLEVLHDTCVVPPGLLQTGTGGQYAVYTPWYRSWVKKIEEKPGLLDYCASPANNSPNTRRKFRQIFNCTIPEIPGPMRLSNSMAEHLATMWPAGEHEALRRLDFFCEEIVTDYDATRNIPSADDSSTLSPYLAAGTISARTCVRVARDSNFPPTFDGAGKGTQGWIRQIAWRDFYRHVLSHWPYVCMNKPFKLELSDLKWSQNQAHFEAWCTGQTGYPLVDAGMRQLVHDSWLPNRTRMVVASFLSKDLLLDWRLGERFFMTHLIDGDFASNNGGWGFSASVGVDPQPYFRIFNPILQSERFDADGDYIRRWVPELRGVQGRAIHDPYGRGAGEKAKAAGYPEMIVDHKESRERALAVYRKDGVTKEP